jgi:hypothetical protein
LASAIKAAISAEFPGASERERRARLAHLLDSIAELTGDRSWIQAISPEGLPKEGKIYNPLNIFMVTSLHPSSMRIITAAASEDIGCPMNSWNRRQSIVTRGLDGIRGHWNLR